MSSPALSSLVSLLLVIYHSHLQPLGEACVLVAQSCPPLYDPRDCSPPGSSVHGIPQARILECVAISFSRGSSPPRDWTWVSCIAGRFFTAEPWGKLIKDSYIWSRIDVQSCVSFRSTVLWFTYIEKYRYVYFYVYCFSDSFPLEISTKYWTEFPVLHTRSLLVIYFIYSRVHRLIAIS